MEPSWARPWLAASRGFCSADFQTQPSKYKGVSPMSLSLHEGTGCLAAARGSSTAVVPACSNRFCLSSDLHRDSATSRGYMAGGRSPPAPSPNGSAGWLLAVAEVLSHPPWLS